MGNKDKMNLHAKPLDSLSQCTLCNCNPYQEPPMLTYALALDKQLIKLSEIEAELACRQGRPLPSIALPLPFGLPFPHHHIMTLIQMDSNVGFDCRSL